MRKMWDCVGQKLKEKMSNLLISELYFLGKLGTFPAHFIQTLQHFLRKTHKNQKSGKIVEKLMFEGLKSHLKSVENHKNHQIYKEIYSVIGKISNSKKKVNEFPYYFETQRCYHCHVPDLKNFQSIKFNDIKQEIKYSNNCIYLKMNNSYELNNIQVTID